LRGCGHDQPGTDCDGLAHLNGFSDGIALRRSYSLRSSAFYGSFQPNTERGTNDGLHRFERRLQRRGSDPEGVHL